MKKPSHQAPSKWIPRRLVSRLAEVLYQIRLSRLLISPYIRRYGVNMEEYVRPINQYHSLVDFFCREIRPELRPIAAGNDILISPVDGRIAEYGVIAKNELIQAKGINYSTARLLGDEEEARRYEGGLYMTIYLSPADYHRIHAPASGSVLRAIQIRGTRWPVNQSGVEGIPQLFEKNERIVSYFETNLFGQVAIVKVGAYIVGKIRVNYEASGRVLNYPLAKGDELGQFEFGSTVVLLFEPGPYRWSAHVKTGNRIKMGQPLAERK